jgi:hypothetical protein
LRQPLSYSDVGDSSLLLRCLADLNFSRIADPPIQDCQQLVSRPPAGADDINEAVTRFILAIFVGYRIENRDRC